MRIIRMAEKGSKTIGLLQRGFTESIKNIAY